MNHLILIDGNNLGFSGMGGPRLSTGDKDTHSTFSFIKRIRHILADYPDSLVMVLWDGRSWRKDVSKEYKANRETTEKQVEARVAYYDQKKDIIEALSLLGVMQASADNMEADDLAEIYSTKYKGDKITLYSADKDWLQLIDKRTSWYDPINMRECNIHTFEEFTGCSSPYQFVEQKCILGDAGDNVKGLNGVGPKKLETIYANWENFSWFLKDLEADPDKVAETWSKSTGKNIPKVIKELDPTAVRELMLHNYKMMGLRTKHRPEPINLKRNTGKLDPEKFEGFCGRLAFLSFLRDYEKFLLPFKENRYVTK